ncbi:MAG: ribosome recycling factor [Elusimicrobiota bacterium]
MKERIAKLKADLGGVRTGRANPLLLEGIKVDYYGQPAPIKQVAAISVPDGRTLEIRPWDPTVIAALEKAIQDSDIGVRPQNDGKVIRLSFPTMTEERRKEVGKLVGKIGEEYRVSIRGDRRVAMESIKKRAKEEKLPEDQRKAFEGAIQKLTDAYIEQVDKTVAEKQEEVASI